MTAGTKGSWSGGGESDGELLVGTADRLRWRAPELALVFARHAATRADAAQDGALALRANALVVAALVRLGKHAEAVEPAVLTLREAESSGARELAGSVRVDLAASTRAIGLAGSAFVLVRPMLEGSDARPSVRAGALAEIVAGLAQAGRREVIDEVLSEADRLYAADDNLSTDVRRVLRALLCARIASFRRRWGNPTGAVAAATEGMTLLDGLAEPATDSGQARAELGLEMVSALLDAGEDAAALGQADQTLNHPVRATSAAAVGRLMLVLATRVHMPSGRPKEAHALLAEIVRVARRHELDGLLADVLTSLAHAQETDGDLTDALDSLRSARAAEQRRLRADTMARLIVLEELGAGTRLPDDTEALLRRVVRTPARSLPDTSGREHTSREIASREMSGRELGGEDIGTQDILARELTGWEMVARERAARDAGSSRTLSELIEADRAAPDWPTSDRMASDRTGSDRPGHVRAASGRTDLDRTSSDWIDSEFTESQHLPAEPTPVEHRPAEHGFSNQTSSDWTPGTGIAAAASSGGGRRRAPVEWSAADRVAADRAVSELASADSDDHAAAVDGPQPKWPDQGVAEERDEETGLLNRQGLRRRLAAARRQSRPTALTLVRLDPAEPDPQPEPHNPDPDSTDRFSAALIKAIDRAGRAPEFDPDVLSSLADHVRDMAPDDAELVRPEEGELAVLMPDTTRDEAEQFAATLRETVSTSDWDPEDPARGVSVSTGVAQYQEGTSEDALLTAAREDLTSTEADAHPDWQSVEPVYDLPPEDSGYTYLQEYAQLSHDGPEPADPEMAEYLAGFSLPEYGQWPHTEIQTWSHEEEPDMPPLHDSPTAGKDDDAETTAGRSVLDRLDITRGSGGRRRAPDSFAADQSADYAQYPPDQPPYPPSDSPYSADKSPHSSDDAQSPSADSPYPSDTSTQPSDRSPDDAQTPPADWPYSPDNSTYSSGHAESPVSTPTYPAEEPEYSPYSSDQPSYSSDQTPDYTNPSPGLARNRRDRSPEYVQSPPDQSPDYGGTGDEILAAADEAAAFADLPLPESAYTENPYAEILETEATHEETPSSGPRISAPQSGSPRNSASLGQDPQSSAVRREDLHGSLHRDDLKGSLYSEDLQGSLHKEDVRGSLHGEGLHGSTSRGDSPHGSNLSGETPLNSAPQASIPHVPDPEEVPAPPNTPDIPAVPNPDIDPQPGRRRYPADPDPAHIPSRRPIPKNPDIDPTPDEPSYPTDPDPDPDRPGFPTDPSPDRHGYSADRDPDRGGFSADSNSDRHGFPTDPSADRRGFPTDPDSDRRVFSADTDPERRGLSTDPSSDRHGLTSGPDRPGFPTDSEPDRRGFPGVDPDRPGFPADARRDLDRRDLDRRGIPSDPDIDPQPRRRGFPSDSDTDPGRRGLPTDRGVDEQGFPVDPRTDRRSMSANSDNEPQPRRRRLPADPGVDPDRGFSSNGYADPQTGRRGLPADSESDQPRERRSLSADSDPQTAAAQESRGGRRRAPDDSADGDSGADEQRAGRRRVPEQDEESAGRRRSTEQVGLAGPGISAGPVGGQAGRRRRIADYLESVERPAAEAASGRRRSSDQADPAVTAAQSGGDTGTEASAGRRRAPEQRPSPQPRTEPQPEPGSRPEPQPQPQPQPRADSKPEPEPVPTLPDHGRAAPKPEPKPEPAPDTPEDPQEPRRRRWASILEGQERPGLPPEPSEPRDPPVAAETGDPGKPSRMRRREKTDVKLADLLAEALVAYQASTADNPDEDVLSAYDDAAGRVVDDNPRRERETGY